MAARRSAAGRLRRPIRPCSPPSGSQRSVYRLNQLRYDLRKLKGHGLLTSGLVSMKPWGFLESRGVDGERGRLEGSAPRWKAVRASVDALEAHAVNAVHLSLSRYAGDFYWLATQADAPSRNPLPEIRLL